MQGSKFPNISENEVFMNISEPTLTLKQCLLSDLTEKVLAGMLNEMTEHTHTKIYRSCYFVREKKIDPIKQCFIDET